MNQEKDLSEYLKDFRVRMISKYSIEVLKRSSRRIKRFSKLGLDVFNIDLGWVYEYCARELESGKMKKSLRSDMEDLGRWCEFTRQDIQIPHFKKEPDPDPWFPTEEEYRKILETCYVKMNSKIRDYLKQKEHERKWFTTALIIKTLGEGGMRVSELVRINLEDVSEKGVFVRSSKKEKNRVVALSPDTLELIKTYILDFRPKTDLKALFTGDYGRLSTTMVRKHVKEAGKKAGVEELHPHALRHFCATRLLKAGIDLRKIQIHLGHSDISSTTLYTHLMTSDVQKEINDLYSSMGGGDFFLQETLKNKAFRSWVQIPKKIGLNKEAVYD